MEVKEALAGYLQQMAANGAAESTRVQAQRHVAKLARWLAAEKRATRIERVRPEDVAAFLASDAVRMRDGGGARKVTSANIMRSTLRTFFRYVADAGLAPTNAARLVKLARCQPPRPKPIGDADVAKLLAELDKAASWSEKRDRAMFRTMLATGMRLGSAIGLDVEDVDLADESLRLRTLKNGGEDVVYLSPATVELLREYLGDRRSAPAFPAQHGGRMGSNTVRDRLGMWATRAGIEGRVWPHRLRHSRASKLYAETGDLLLVSRALCHRSIASTVTYARCAPERLREAAGRG